MASSSHPPTPLLYSCVAYHDTILAESAISASSQITSLANLILPKIDHSTPQKLTYTHGNSHIHYVSESPSNHPANAQSAGGLTFLVVSDSTLGRRVAFGFLLEARKRFLDLFPPGENDFSTMPNYGTASFNGDLKKLMIDCGNKQDSIALAQREIDDVRGIMTQNIEGLLERGERIDLLVDKTDRLGGSAREFRVRSRGLKRQMWWKNAKLMSLLVIVVVLIVLAIIIAVKNSVPH